MEHIRKAADLGFDAVELPLMDPRRLDSREIRSVLHDTNLAVCCGTGLGPSNDVSSIDPYIRKLGLLHLLDCLSLAKEVGSASLGGVLHSAWGKRERITEDQRKWSADILGQVASRASQLGMTISLECINRYESSFLNTVQQGLHMLQLIGMDNVGLHLDTYHMNIEERSIPAGLELAGKHLFHMHLSENTRGFPGTGSIAWPDVFKAVTRINYNGLLVIESYVLAERPSSDDVCIWRPIEEDIDESLRNSLGFVRLSISRSN